MKKWQKILVAILVCGIIWAVYLTITINAGFEHGGGAIPMMIVVGIIIYVWKNLVGKKPGGDNVNENNEINSTEPTTQDSIESENIEKVGLNTREVELIQEGITVTMLLPVEIIDEMDRLKGQDSEKWINNSFELVREAKRNIFGVSNNAKNDSCVELITCTKTENIVDVEHAIVGDKSNDEIETPFDGKLESEQRREAKITAHWIVQDGTEMCIKIEEAVYRKMVELQTNNPKRWVNKEWDLYQKAKSILQK